MKTLILLTLIASVAAPAAATDFAAPNVVIPIVGRTAGAFGSQWQTDLVVMNAARTGNPQPVVITFIRNDGVEQQLEETLAPRESLVLKDVVKDTFGLDSATGIVRVAASDAGAKIAARARIYNTGSVAGQYGQIVHGMPATKLSREAYLPGLSAAEGNRVNVGVANPADATVAVFVSLYDESGEFHGAFGITVAPRSVRQINNIFQEFDDAPLDRGTIQITSTHGVYAYASIVRNDTGDADFITATAAKLDEEPIP